MSPTRRKSGRKRRPTRQPHSAHRIVAFATDIADRHRWRSGGTEQIALVFHLPVRPVVLNPMLHEHHAHSSIDLTLGFGASIYPTLRTTDVRLQTHQSRTTEVSFIVERQRVENLVQQLASREVRVDSLAPVYPSAPVADSPPSSRMEATRSPVASAPAQVIAPVTRVLANKPAHAQADAKLTDAELPRRATEIVSLDQHWRTPINAPPTTLSGAEVNRLAEQVIQVIDKRLIASRERLGKS